MEFSNELKDILILVARRFWLLLICIIICAVALFTTAPLKYEEEMKRFDMRQTEHKNAIGRDIVINTPLIFEFNSDLSEDDLLKITSLEVHMRQYDTAKMILTTIEDKITDPLDVYTLMTTYGFSRTYGKSNTLNLRVISSNTEDAILLRNALVEEIKNTWPQIEPDTGGIVILDIETLPDDPTVITFDLPLPSYSSILLSLALMAMMGGIFTGTLAVIIWNGISPVLGSAPNIQDKLGIRVYGEIKYRERGSL